MVRVIHEIDEHWFPTHNNDSTVTGIQLLSIFDLKETKHVNISSPLWTEVIVDKQEKVSLSTPILSSSSQSSPEQT